MNIQKELSEIYVLKLRKTKGGSSIEGYLDNLRI